MNISKMVLFFLLSFATPCFLQADEETAHEILIEIRLKCPMSEELKAFARSIPSPENQSVSLDEWKASFTNNMTSLAELIESKKLYDASWSVKTDDSLPFLINE